MCSEECLSEFCEEFDSGYTLVDDLKVLSLRHYVLKVKWKAIARVVLFGWKRFGYIANALSPTVTVDFVISLTTEIPICLAHHRGTRAYIVIRQYLEPKRCKSWVTPELDVSSSGSRANLTSFIGIDGNRNGSARPRID